MRSTPIVESVWVTRTGGRRDVVRTFPTGHATLLVTVPIDGGDTRVDLSGPTTEPTTRTGAANAEVVGVRLHPWALGSVAGGAAQELRDRVVELTEVMDGAVDWPRRWAGLGTSAIVERVLAELRLIVPGDRASLAQFVVQAVGLGSRSMSQLAECTGLGVRQLERIVLAHTGLTPTRVRVAQRLERAADLLAGGVAPVSVAHAAGFADQAHLTRSFRELVGITPGAFSRTQCPERGVGIVQDARIASA